MSSSEREKRRGHPSTVHAWGLSLIGVLLGRFGYLRNLRGRIITDALKHAAEFSSSGVSGLRAKPTERSSSPDLPLCSSESVTMGSVLMASMRLGLVASMRLDDEIEPLL